MKDGQCVCVFGSTQDITEQREMKQEIQETNRHSKQRDEVDQSKQTLKHLTDTIPGAVYRFKVTHKKELSFDYISRGAKQLLGLETGEIIESFDRVLELIHPEDREKMRATIDDAIQRRGLWRNEFRIKHDEDSYKWILGKSDFDCLRPDGSMIWNGILLDIPKRKKIEKESELNNYLLELAQELSSMGFWNWQVDEDQVEWSNQLYEIYGLDKDSFESTFEGYLSLVHPDDREATKNVILDATNHKTDFTFKERIIRPDREIRHLKTWGESRLNKNGDVNEIFGACMDVTEQQKIEQKLSTQVSLLDHILNSLPGLFYILDKELMLVKVNRSVEKLFDKSAEELTGTSVLNFVASGQEDQIREAIGKVFEKGYAELDTVLIDGNGEEHHYYINGSLIELHGENYIIGNGIDITQRVEAEEENVILMQEVHHRVKNNLAIISGMLSMELDELATDSRNRSVLERSVNRIQAIAKIHEMLYKSPSFSKIKVDNYAPELVNTVKGTLEVGDKIDIQLEIDEVMMNINEIIPLGMLLNELLTNSYKYAFQDQQGGSIALNISQRGKLFYVRYQDNGRGFDQSMFDNSETLGFTIIKTLLQQLEADYEVDTDDGFKIDFTFEKQERGSHAII
jgi:PAS domain S-box-containing protein